MNKNKKNNTVAEETRKVAAEWVARLYSGNASQADEDELDAWLSADPAHGVEYFKMLEIWDSAGTDAVTEMTLPACSSEQSTAFPHWLKVPLAAAAVLMLMIFSAGFLTGPSKDIGSEAVQAYATKVGETRELVLDDGSVVTLNTDTRLFVDFSGTIRRVILDSGEAFFDVAKNPSRPFVVTAGSQSVTVLGTRFNVQRKGVKLTVAVVEGKVAVHENLEPEKLEDDARTLLAMPSDDEAREFQHYLLEAGSVGTFEKSAELVGAVAVADAESYQSWRQGVLRFSGQSLADVVSELSRYTEKKIEISDDVAAAMSISGVFHHDDLEGALAGLEAMLPITVTRSGDRIEIALAREN